MLQLSRQNMQDFLTEAVGDETLNFATNPEKARNAALNSVNAVVSTQDALVIAFAATLAVVTRAMTADPADIVVTEAPMGLLVTVRGVVVGHLDYERVIGSAAKDTWTMRASLTLSKEAIANADKVLFGSTDEDAN